MKKLTLTLAAMALLSVSSSALAYEAFSLKLHSNDINMNVSAPVRSQFINDQSFHYTSSKLSKQHNDESIKELSINASGYKDSFTITVVNNRCTEVVVTTLEAQEFNICGANLTIKEY